MNLYNMISGFNPLSILLIPMLGDKHTDEYPRFRDAFMQDEEHPEYDGYIHIFTRVGGGNRNQGYGEEELMQHPNFVDTFDDLYDCTYATYVFSVPDKWKKDYDKLISGKCGTISKALQKQVDKVFPELKGKLPWHIKATTTTKLL